MKLPIGGFLAMRQLLTALDGCERVAGDRVVQEPYRFGGETHLALAKIGNRLTALHETTEKTRVAIVKAHAPEGATSISPEQHPEAFAAFVKEYQAVLDTVEDLKLPTINLADLRLDENHIPAASVLTPLMSLGLLVE